MSRRQKKRLDNDDEPREFLLKDKSQEYAYIEKALGHGQFRAQILSVKGDGIPAIRHAIARGSMSRRRQFVSDGDVALVALRDFEEDKVDIIHLYRESEIARLIECGELPSNVFDPPQGDEIDAPSNFVIIFVNEEDGEGGEDDHSDGDDDDDEIFTNIPSK